MSMNQVNLFFLGDSLATKLTNGSNFSWSLAGRCNSFGNLQQMVFVYKNLKLCLCCFVVVISCCLDGQVSGSFFLSKDQAVFCHFCDLWILRGQDNGSKSIYGHWLAGVHMDGLCCHLGRYRLACLCDSKGTVGSSGNGYVALFGGDGHCRLSGIFVVPIGDGIILCIYQPIIVLNGNLRCLLFSIVSGLLIGKSDGAVRKGCLLQCRDILSIGGIAVCTLVGFGSLFQISRLLGNDALFPLMWCCICLFPYIAVSTSHTGVRDKSFLCTGGLCNFSLIAVSQCTSVVCDKYVITVFTAIGGVSFFGTGRCFYNHITVMSGGFLVIGNIRKPADATGIFRISFFRTGRLDYFFFILMSCSPNIMICVGIATVFTAVIGISTLCTGWRYYSFFILML